MCLLLFYQFYYSSYECHMITQLMSIILLTKIATYILFSNYAGTLGSCLSSGLYDRWKLTITVPPQIA